MSKMEGERERGEEEKRLTSLITSDTGWRAFAVRLALSMTRPDKILIS